MMTPEQVAAEYLKREKTAKETVAGQDPAAIIETLAQEIGMDSAEVTEIVLDYTLYGAF